MGRKRRPALYKCKVCGADVEGRTGRIRHYCSNVCRHAGSVKPDNRKCPTCGVGFRAGRVLATGGTRVSSGHKFCSKSCANKGLVGRQVGPLSAVWRGGIKRQSWMAYAHQARKRGLRFTLSQEQFDEFWQRDCFYCGEGIATIGLDRYDNSGGYTAGNVVPCCFTCNSMKSAMAVGEFIEQVNKIATHTSTLPALRISA